MDTTLTWHEHVNKTISNMESKIYAVRVIQRFFENHELLVLLKAYCNPSLYYASNVWLTPSLNANLKSKLFSISDKILSVIKAASFKNLHKEFTRATPEMWQNYELSIFIYDLMLTKLPLQDWQILQNNTLQNRRSNKTHFTSTNN